jgi:molecular chaperone GrpE
MKNDRKHPEKESAPGPQQDGTRKPETAQGPGQESGPEQELQQVRGQLQTLRSERDELFGRLQRLSADYANYQKRVHKQIADSVGHERETVMRSLLPVCDNLEMTIQQAKESNNLQAILTGVQIVYAQMMDVLRTHDVEPIKALDQKFDPTLHQALQQRSDPDKEDDLVLEECQKGYLLAGRILRPSRVIVNRAAMQSNPNPPEASSPQSTEEKTPDVE